MRKASVGLGLLVICCGLGAQAQPGPVGYILTADGLEKGCATLTYGRNAPRSGPRSVKITSETLQRRIYVHRDDKFAVSGDVVVWYLTGNRVKAAKMGESSVQYRPQEPGPETPRGKGPQGEPDEKAPSAPIFLFGERR